MSKSEKKDKNRKSKTAKLGEDGFIKSCGVRLDVIVDRQIGDSRFERERAYKLKLQEGGFKSQMPQTASSAFEAIRRVATGKEARTIAEKLADPHRPTWEQYKKENEDKLGFVGGEVKKMVEYRVELDREREKKLSLAGPAKKVSNAISDDESDDDEDKKKKKKKRRKGEDGDSSPVRLSDFLRGDRNLKEDEAPINYFEQAYKGIERVEIDGGEVGLEVKCTIPDCFVCSIIHGHPSPPQDASSNYVVPPSSFHYNLQPAFAFGLQPLPFQSSSSLQPPVPIQPMAPSMLTVPSLNVPGGISANQLPSISLPTLCLPFLQQQHMSSQVSQTTMSLGHIPYFSLLQSNLSNSQHIPAPSISIPDSLSSMVPAMPNQSIPPIPSSLAHQPPPPPPVAIQEPVTAAASIPTTEGKRKPNRWDKRFDDEVKTKSHIEALITKYIESPMEQ